MNDPILTKSTEISKPLSQHSDNSSGVRFTIHANVWLRQPVTRECWRFMWITSDVRDRLLANGWELVEVSK